jgi:Fic family protein
MARIYMRIIKKKRGNEEYFYLQHTIREKGEVKTKEKYLGKEIPKNIDDIIKEFRRELLKDTYNKFDKINSNFKKHWKKVPESVKAKEKEEISIVFTYNTNAIENSTITLEETREIIHDHISPNKPLEDVKETEAHSNVFLQMLNKKISFSDNIILKWHEDIFSETKKDIAGKYRNYLVRVGSYIAPSNKDVKPMMFVLVDFIKKSKIHPVELAARAHYRFEKIHPFGDGNGRIGRLIMNHILWYEDFPMIIIEVKKRKAYYKALQKDEESFVKYFFRTYLSAHKRWID